MDAQRLAEAIRYFSLWYLKGHSQSDFHGYRLSILSRRFKLPVPHGENRMTTEVPVAGSYNAYIVRLSIPADCKGHNGRALIA